jgi:hypothetical protein
VGLGPGELPPTSISLDPLRALVPSTAAALQALATSAKAHPLAELLAARNELSMRWFPLEGAPDGEDRSRALERARAIRWLTEATCVELTSTSVK